MVDPSSTPDTAISKLRTAMIDLTSKQFDQLVVFLHRELEEEATIEFVPTDGSALIDLEVTVPYLFGTFRYGIRLEQVSQTSNVDTSVVEEVAAAVDSTDRKDTLHAGVVMTTGEFSSEAEAIAAENEISLVDGQRLASLFVENEVGIDEVDGKIVLNEGFWELFRGQTRTNIIPSLEIPQADSIERLNQTLAAVESGNHDKAAIAEAVESISDDSFDPRQADYYGTAGWLLGFLHKDLDSREVKGRGRWGLTRLGRTYLAHRNQGNEEQANALLYEQIRDIEIIRRILLKLEEEGVMRRKAITKIVGEESELGGSTVPRRTRTLINWLEQLPEIEASGRGSSQQLRYRDVPDSTSTDVSLETTPNTDESDPDIDETPPPADEDSILDEIMSSFEK